MRKLWHLYFSGTDCVDINKEWFEPLVGTVFCSECHAPLHYMDYCPNFVIDQPIPKKDDMAFLNGCDSVGIMSINLKKFFRPKCREILKFRRFLF